jgi:polyisoprenoid-binding protein YceI
MTDTFAQTAQQTGVETGVWDVDLDHSSVEFVARHLMATKVRGRFTKWSATLTTGVRPSDGKVEAVIDATSITTLNEGRDSHLRTADFFEVEKHPTIEFHSTAVNDLDDNNHFIVTGDLTIRGVTKPVTLDADFVAAFDDPYGRTKATFSASAELKREDWGVSWNQPLANGGFVVSKTIKLEIEVQFILRKDAPAEA